MKTVAEKIIDGLDKFADDLENGRPIQTRTVTRNEWVDGIELMETLKVKREKLNRQ